MSYCFGACKGNRCFILRRRSAKLFLLCCQARYSLFECHGQALSVCLKCLQHLQSGASQRLFGSLEAPCSAHTYIVQHIAAPPDWTPRSASLGIWYVLQRLQAARCSTRLGYVLRRLVSASIFARCNAVHALVKVQLTCTIY